LPEYQPNIALLLFTRTPAEEAKHKKLVLQGMPGQQYTLAASLVQHSQEVLAATGLPYVVISSDQQTGSTFAERLQGAFAHVFALGYDQVIAIGNDCLQLTPQDILAATKAFLNQDVVLGPDKSGGLYLFGLSRRAFKQCDSFNVIRWNTSHVLIDVQNLFKATARIYVLPVKYFDINKSQDLYYVIKHKLTKGPLHNFFKRLLQIINNWFTTDKFEFLTQASPHSHLFRGPPTSPFCFNLL